MYAATYACINYVPRPTARVCTYAQLESMDLTIISHDTRSSVVQVCQQESHGQVDRWGSATLQERESMGRFWRSSKIRGQIGLSKKKGKAVGKPGHELSHCMSIACPRVNRKSIILSLALFQLLFRNYL